MSRAYSGIPATGRRTWIVPRWLKEAFVAFAIVAIVVVGVSKLVQHFGGKGARAASALDADEMPPASAPAFSLPTRDGKPLELSAYRGKVVLLNFWATWCPPCREEEPSLRKLAESIDPAAFALVAVSVDDGGWPVIDQFFAGKPPPYAVALDQGARISQRYGTTKFPESYLIDQNGTLRLKFIGPRNWSDPNVFTLLESLGAHRIDRGG
jgi:cytochrome c biogenesis protein CcmG, thiol:disulfide interchange protein DsbE